MGSCWRGRPISPMVPGRAQLCRSERGQGLSAWVSTGTACLRASVIPIRCISSNTTLQLPPEASSTQHVLGSAKCPLALIFAERCAPQAASVLAMQGPCGLSTTTQQCRQLCTHQQQPR